MSKLTKFVNSPGQFFKDSKVSKAMFGKQKDKPVIEKKQTSQVKKQVKTDVEYSLELLEFKKSFPVNNIKYKDEIFWPVLRHFLWVRLQHAYKGSKNISNVNPVKTFVNKDWCDNFRTNYHFSDYDDLGGANELDYLFFTNLRGTEQTKVDGKIYNRITDPVFEKALEVGVAEKIELIKSHGEVELNRIHTPTFVIPPLVRKIGRSNYLSVPKDLYKQLKLKVPSAEFDERSMIEAVEWFFHARDIYKTILMQKKPKVVFYVGFDYYYPLALAAKELGIKSVDLQHGVQGGWSPLYNHWSEIPPGGYSVLPDYFWVWGEHDYNAIKLNFDCEQVSPIIGGFRWVDRQFDFLDELPKTITGRLVKDKLVGVITLQDQQSFPQLFAEIIEKTSDSVVWIVKRHPKFKSINLRGLKGIIIGQTVDELPFANYMKHADIHLTECSTAVLEAGYFGVRNFVSGKQGYENYSDFIKNGTVTHVKSADAFIEKINNIDFSNKTAEMDAIQQVDTKFVLRELLKRDR